jgi:hypothetical protein
VARSGLERLGIAIAVKGDGSVTVSHDKRAAEAVDDVSGSAIETRSSIERRVHIVYQYAEDPR